MQLHGAPAAGMAVDAFTHRPLVVVLGIALKYCLVHAPNLYFSDTTLAV